MLSFGKILLAATAILAAVVSATPVAQSNAPAPLNVGVEAIEKNIPKKKAFKGKDPGPVAKPATTASPTPSPRFTAPIRIASDL